MRVLVVDDHAGFRLGLKSVLTELRANAPLEIIEADTADAAVALANEPIDLILLDLMMPGTNGRESFDRVAQAFETVRLFIVSSDDSAQLIRATIESGASGFIPKASNAEILRHALGIALAGGTYIPDNVLRYILNDSPPLQTQTVSTDTDGATSDATPKSPGQFGENKSGLTQRQLEVLKAVVRGGSNKHIARELNVSQSTVKAHLSTAFRVLGVRNRTQAVMVLARDGYPTPIDPPETN